MGRRSRSQRPSTRALVYREGFSYSSPGAGGRTSSRRAAPLLAAARRPREAPNREENAANRKSRRPDSNRGPLHYEGKTSEGRASTRGYVRAPSRWKLVDFSAHAVDTHARRAPRDRPDATPRSAAREDVGVEIEMPTLLRAPAASSLRGRRSSRASPRSRVTDRLRAMFQVLSMAPRACRRGLKLPRWAPWGAGPRPPNCREGSGARGCSLTT